MDRNERFDELAREWFDDTLRRDPVMATWVGIHTHDGNLPLGTRAAVQDRIRANQRFLERFKRFSPAGLSPDRQIDRELALQSLRLGLFEDREVARWRSDPDAADMIGHGIFLLFVREFAPLADRLRAIAERLKKVPQFLAETQARIETPVALWAEMAAQAAERLPELFREVENAARGILPEQEASEVAAAAEEASRAMESHRQWLLQEVKPRAKAHWAVGEKKFRELLRLRGLGKSAAEILTFGKSRLAGYQKELRNLAARIRPAATVGDIRQYVRSKHPMDFQALLGYVERSVAKAKAFIGQSGFAPLPEGERLEVMPTPSYLRHVIPFGAYVSPGKFEPEQRGIYFVTMYDGQPELLEEHSYASLGNMTVHEGYPGHHLQHVWANRHPSRVRALAAFATEYVEGWAHYCEEELKDLGYENDLESCFVQTLDMVWRAARVVIDVELSSGRMSFEDAVAMLMRETGMDKRAAEAEVRRYTKTPGYQLSYLLGKEMIRELRRDIRQAMGSRFRAAFFHQALLEGCALPISLARKEILRKARQTLRDSRAGHKRKQK